MLSITASKIGPRVLRSPTSARLMAGVDVTYGGNSSWPGSVPGYLCGFLAFTLTLTAGDVAPRQSGRSVTTTW